jgi:hypothetical protein
MGWREDVKLGIARITELYLGDAGGQMGTLVTSTPAELNIMDGVTATAAEINEAADKSDGAIVSITAATLDITQALHAGKVCVFNKVDGIDVTLPEATGTGDVYTFVLGLALTSDTITILTPDIVNSDMVGNVLTIDLDSATTGVWYSSIQSDGNNAITMNMTSQGGINIGTDWYRITDIAADIFAVEGQYLVPTSSNPATPFSNRS